MAAPAALMEMVGLVEAFLLRLPPDDPASLVRAALVCKLWRRIVADRGFRRRFRDFHRTPRLLGVIHGSTDASPCFVATSAIRPRNANMELLKVLDSRHGRVLLLLYVDGNESFTKIAVWDPITGEKLLLPWLVPPLELDPFFAIFGWRATVLCASSCSGDHLDCGGCRHFLVVFICSSPQGVHVYVYSSEAGSWTLTASAAQLPFEPHFMWLHYERSTLAGSALHFLVQVEWKLRICKYDLGTQEISWIEPPPSCSIWCFQVVLTSTHNGGLGCARLENSSLHLWSREVGSNGLLGWTQTRVIELETMLPSNTSWTSLSLAAFVHGVGVFLVTTDDGLFSTDVESDVMAKLCESREINNVVPYVSFCTPAPGTTFTREEPSAGLSSA